MEQVSLNEAATCFYSVHVPRHEYKRMAEIDFLVVLTDFVLVVEVKGGRLARRDGVWTFTDRYGDVHEKREGPFDQARSAMFALETGLRSRLPGVSAGFGAVVVTPDQSLDRDLEWDPAEHLGPAAMTVAGFEAGLAASIRFWRSRLPSVRVTGQYQQILGVFRPDFDRVPRLALLANAFEADYVALASEQYDMLSGTEVNARISCTGGAGSGKTLLAVESARRAHETGAKVLLTCRSAAIIELMKRSLGDCPVDCLPWSEAAGRGPYDILIVDEAQDLMNVDDYFILDELLLGGLADGRWRMFSDPNNQARVDGSFDPDVYTELTGGAAQYHLRYNCRNTSSIVQQTQMLTGADLGVAKAGHGPAVDFVRPADDHDTAALLDAHLKRLRKEEIDLSQVVVITLRDTTDVSSAAGTRAFARQQLVSSAAGDAAGSSGVARLATAQGFKGLEAPHVLVIDIDDVSTPEAMSRLYVAMTRPRVSLWLAVGPIAWHQLTSPSQETAHD